MCMCQNHLVEEELTLVFTVRALVNRGEGIIVVLGISAGVCLCAEPRGSERGWYHAGLGFQDLLTFSHHPALPPAGSTASHIAP